MSELINENGRTIYARESDIIYPDCDIVRGDTEEDFFGCSLCYRYEICKKSDNQIK